jgi:dTDP-4-dehydrorhamnose 3,5-epimerase-like enzyme
MTNSGVTSKFSVQHLEFMEPPLPKSGGRVATPAGELAQIVSGETIHHIVYIEFKPNGKARGNHFHKKMSHVFYVIKGKIDFLLEDLEDHSRARVTLKTGDLLRIRPNCAHSSLAQEYSQVIETNNMPYDPADTIPYVMNSLE